MTTNRYIVSVATMDGGVRKLGDYKAATAAEAAQMAADARSAGTSGDTIVATIVTRWEDETMMMEDDILYPSPLTPGAWYDIHSFDLAGWRDAGGNIVEHPAGADWTDWFVNGFYRGPCADGIWPELVPASAPPRSQWWYGTCHATMDGYDAVCRRYSAQYPTLAIYHFRVCGQPRCAEVIEPGNGSVDGMWVLAEIVADTMDWAHCDRMAAVMQAAVDRHLAQIRRGAPTTTAG